ncbi:hypothetical protein EVAR_16096_1 [Eumeta japonica]|uniref:Uncharacterized protein n=1 Tax=Eumeta variegata TaxID=151549 RepID=A0A4C1UID8_EUMVA|nr:hypothetical protein EVAR_16096_1 [Eumeta japonica]
MRTGSMQATVEAYLRSRLRQAKWPNTVQNYKRCRERNPSIRPAPPGEKLREKSATRNSGRPMRYDHPSFFVHTSVSVVDEPGGRCRTF